MIRIPISEKTKRILDRKPDLGKNMFSEDGWRKNTFKEITGRKTGYLERPLVDMFGRPVRLKHEFTDRLYGEAHVYTCSPDTEPEVIILYIHGGGFVFCGDVCHERLCDSLCSSLNAEVVMPFYKLAPQGNFADAYELLNTVYDELTERKKPVCIMGDSAGGGLALGFAMNLREQSKKMPEKLVLLSPFIDVTVSNPEIPEYEERDLMLSEFGMRETGRLWADGVDKKDYRVSPLFGEMKYLPPTLITVGTEEMLYPDNLILYEKFMESNEMCELIEGEGMFHAFPLFGNTEEARRCCDMIVDFIRNDL